MCFYRFVCSGLTVLIVLSLVACGGGGSDSVSVAKYTIGGTVSGLNGVVTLQNNSGNDLTIDANGEFTFTTAIDDLSSYSVSVSNQPVGQICSISNSSGALAGSNVTNVTVDCLKELVLTPQSVKTFHFSWTDESGETEYRLLEDADGVSGYSQIATITADTTGHDLEVLLPARINARYILQTCNDTSCSDSAPTYVAGSLAEAAGYIKASNTGASDEFGKFVSLAADGNTLAIGATGEASNATGINGDQLNNSSLGAGAVYVFSRSGKSWTQQAYLKASNTGAGDQFGFSVSLNADGNTLVVGAVLEDNNATGIGNALDNNLASAAGAVYVFIRSGTTWSQQAYIKASNTGADDLFGGSVSLSADGNMLAVGSTGEDSSAIGIDGDQSDNSAAGAGAVYVFSRAGTTWSQQAYLKASNTGAGDRFGYPVALAADGNTLAVGAANESSNATGVDGNQTDNTAINAGAVYVFSRAGTTWSQQAYIKASNTELSDQFKSVVLSADGNTLAVSALGEASSATGVDGDQLNNLAGYSGAVYVFTRNNTTWSQQAYIKASNTEADDSFGWSIALSGDSNTLAVGAYAEDSNTNGIGGNQVDNMASRAGAVYVFTRSGTIWSQQAYIKAPTPEVDDFFGWSLSLPFDGSMLVVGATGEDSNATGVGNDQTNNLVSGAGAVYLY